MDTPITIKRWIGDGNAVIVDCGFIPSFAIMFEDTEGTSPDIFFYSKIWHDDESLYALKLTGTSGVVTRMTTTATGLDEYETVLEGVWVPSPSGGDDQFRIPETYSSTQDYSSTYTQSQTGNTVTCTARTAAAAGTIIRPTTRNGFVYELATASTTGGTEPTWPTTIGTTVSDAGGNVWTCRAEKVGKHGCQGLKVGATAQTDGDFTTLVAFKSSVDKNVGDAGDLAETDIA